MQPAEAIMWIRESWAWVGTLSPQAQPGLVLALAFSVPWILRTYLAAQWEAATNWATAKVSPLLGETLTAAFRKAIQGVPSLAIGAAIGVILHGGDVGAILREQFYVVFAPLIHEALKRYQGGNAPAVGGFTPKKLEFFGPTPVDLPKYDGDDAPSNPPPPRVPPAAVLPLLIAIGLGLSQTCCTGSLVTAQHDALRARYGSTPGDVGYAPSQHCIDLDDAHITWGGIAVGSAVVTGASGVATLPADELPERVRGPAKYTAAGVALGAAVLTAAALDLESGYSESWVRDGCQP